MRNDPASVNLHVFDMRAAEHDNEFGVLDNVTPGHHHVWNVGTPDHVRHECERRTEAVIAAFVDVATTEAEETLEDARCVVKTPGARPPVGTSIDGLVAMFRFHSADFASDQIQRAIPRDRDKRFAAAIVWTFGTGVAQIALTYVGPVDPQRAAHHARKAADQYGRFAVPLEWMHAEDLTGFIGHYIIDAPVRRGRCDRRFHAAVAMKSTSVVGGDAVGEREGDTERQSRLTLLAEAIGLNKAARPFAQSPLVILIDDKRPFGSVAPLLRIGGILDRTFIQIRIVRRHRTEL